MTIPVKALAVSLLAMLCIACAQRPIQLYDEASAGVATISLPEELEVQSLNGVEVKGAKGMLTRGEKVLELAPGRYEALVFYREVWNPNGDHEVFRSNPAMFVIDAQPAHRYKFGYARPRSRDEALALSENFSGWVEDQATGVRIVSKDSGLEFKRGVIAQFQGDDSLVSKSAAGGPIRQQSVEPLPAAGKVAIPAPVAAVPAVKPVAPPVVAIAPAASVTEAEGRVPLMKAWWKQATADERRAALRFMGGDADEGSGNKWLETLKNWWKQSGPAERREFLAWAGEQP